MRFQSFYNFSLVPILLGVVAIPVFAQVNELPPMSSSEKTMMERLKREKQAKEAQKQKFSPDEVPTGVVDSVRETTSEPLEKTILRQQQSGKSNNTVTLPSGKVIMMPKNARLDYTGHGWTCERGYQQVRDECVRVMIPPNARLDYTGHGWTCERGYQQVRDECVRVMMPPNARLDYTGHGWTCERGYQQVRDKCVRVMIPPNARLDYTGHSWTCQRGYQQVRDECVALLQAR